MEQVFLNGLAPYVENAYELVIVAVVFALGIATLSAAWKHRDDPSGSSYVLSVISVGAVLTSIFLFIRFEVNIVVGLIGLFAVAGLVLGNAPRGGGWRRSDSPRRSRRRSRRYRY